MKILQIVDGLEAGDGVGNTVIALEQFLKKLNYETQIIDGCLNSSMVSNNYFDEDNIVFYHMANNMDPLVKKIRCKKILVFHNITYPELIEEFDPYLARYCAVGLYEMQKTCIYFDYAMVFSNFSKKCLVEAGWEEEKIFVLPLMVRYDKFLIEPSKKIVQKYSDGYENIIFMGRVYPNKKHEDIIKLFNEYFVRINQRSRLFLVGALQSKDYYDALMNYVKTLGIENQVIFTGYTEFDEYIGYYSIADLFLCMSEHEGFCIPLVEAMYFNVPIIAYNCTAIPDTLGVTDGLVDTKEIDIVVNLMDRILHDKNYNAKVLEQQKKRIAELSNESIETMYSEVVYKLISQSPPKIKEENIDNAELVIENRLLRGLKKYSFCPNIDNPIIIYGAGKWGKQLYKNLTCFIDKKSIVVCDKKNSGEYNEIMDCVIFNPKEAIMKYPNSLYIISLMDKKRIVEVTEFLVENKIKSELIAIYDKYYNCIY